MLYSLLAVSLELVGLCEAYRLLDMAPITAVVSVNKVSLNISY